jgi:hypothetical protein
LALLFEQFPIWLRTLAPNQVSQLSIMGFSTHDAFAASCKENGLYLSLIVYYKHNTARRLNLPCQWVPLVSPSMVAGSSKSDVMLQLLQLFGSFGMTTLIYILFYVGSIFGSFGMTLLLTRITPLGLAISPMPTFLMPFADITSTAWWIVVLLTTMNCHGFWCYTDSFMDSRFAQHPCFLYG